MRSLATALATVVFLMLVAASSVWAESAWDNLSDQKIGICRFDRQRTLAKYCKVLRVRGKVEFQLHPDVVSDPRAIHVFLKRQIYVRKTANINKEVLKQLCRAAGFAVAAAGPTIAVGPTEALDRLSAAKQSWPAVDWEEVERNAGLAVWLAATIDRRDTSRLKRLDDLLSILDRIIMRGPGKPLFKISHADATKPLPPDFKIDKPSPAYDILADVLTKVGLKYRARGGLLEMAETLPEVPAIAAGGLVFEPAIQKAFALALRKRTVLVVLCTDLRGGASVPLRGPEDVASKVLRGSGEARKILDEVGAVVSRIELNGERAIPFEAGSLQGGKITTQKRTGKLSSLFGVNGQGAPHVVVYVPALSACVASLNKDQGPEKVLEAVKKALALLRRIPKANDEAP